MPRYVQPSLFGELAFLPRRRKRVITGRRTFLTGDYRSHQQPPLGVVWLAQRAARAKIARKRAA